jgi:hypothetical protein
MPAMLNPVVCVAFHGCWRAVPRGNCWRIHYLYTSHLIDAVGMELCRTRKQLLTLPRRKRRGFSGYVCPNGLR